LTELRGYDAWKTTEDEPRRATGPRLEPPAVCYECGEDVHDPIELDWHAFCSLACRDRWARR
jgi:hypothetical protein